MKTLSLIFLVAFVMLNAAILPAACTSYYKDVKAQKDKETRKESREKRLAYKIAHHSND